MYITQLTNVDGHQHFPNDQETLELKVFNLVIIKFFFISVRQWSGRPGFNFRSCHTKDFKNGTWYLLV